MIVSKWNRQPPPAAKLVVEVVSRGGFVTYGFGEAPLVPPGLTVAKNGLVRTVGVDGVSPLYSGGSGDIKLNGSVTGSSPSQATLFALVEIGGVGIDGTIIGQTNTSIDQNPLFRLMIYSSNNNLGLQVRDNAGTAINLQTGVGEAVGKSHFVVGVYRNSGEKSIWLDGKKYAIDNTSFAAMTFSGTQVGVLSRISDDQRFKGNIPLAGILPYAMSDAEVRAFCDEPWAIFRKRRNQVSRASDIGGSVVTTSASGRLRARGADVVAPIKAAAETGRLRARGATSAQPISVVAVTGRLRARGSDVVTSIRPAASAGRLRAHGGCTAAQVSAGIIVTSAAGRLRARGSCTTTSIRAVAVTGRIKARGADAATSIRVGLATGRIKARGANSSAAVVAGTVVTSAAGRLRARGSSSSATTRIVGEVGRLRLRGVVAVATIRLAGVGGRLLVRGLAAAGPYVPPTLPLEVPEPTRTLNAQEGRIGSSPVAADPRRLGAATTRKAPPRLG